MSNKPDIQIPDENLDNSGFTNSGKIRFKKTVEDYNQLLFDKAVNYAEIDKATNAQREVTHEHVKAASHSIAKSYGKPLKPSWFPWAKFGQYAATGLVGLSVSNLPDIWALILFVTSFAVGGALLFLTEKNNSK
jgi:hypothetical protein